MNGGSGMFPIDKQAAITNIIRCAHKTLKSGKTMKILYAGFAVFSLAA